MSATNRESESLIVANGICKSFSDVRALDSVDLELASGEILAVVGENGAGKSTLMKILAGVIRPNTGNMVVSGKPYKPRTVQDALETGICLIHQELNLAGNLDIASNICLGREPSRFGFIKREALRNRAQRAMKEIAFDESVDRRVDELTIGQRQLVEIAKALSMDTRVLIMDEPTSSLSIRETNQLFEVVRQLRSRGVGIIYISHRLAEVEAIADRVLVLRDGCVSGQLKHDEIDRERMMQLMIGRDFASDKRKTHVEFGEPRLQLSHLRTSTFPEATISLHVRAGEIVGLAGLVGAGRTELLETIFGIENPIGGAVFVDGKEQTIRTTGKAITTGLALVPEDRQLHGLIVEHTIRENINLADLSRSAWMGFVNRKRQRTIAEEIFNKVQIRAINDRQITGTLSGGNQQKVVLGKWLAMKPDILLLDEPTRGVDVGARSEIYRIIEELAARGTAILFASSDLEEMIALADRALVMRDGVITGELTAAQITEEAIMRLATISEDAA